MKKLKLRAKLMVSFLALVILVTALIGYISYVHTTKIVEEQVNVTYKQALQQAAINITYRLQEVENISNLTIMNKQLQDILKREKAGYKENEKEQMLNDFRDLLHLITNLENNRNVFRVRLFVSGDSLYSREHNNIFPIQTIDALFLEQLMALSGDVWWQSTYKQNYLPRQSYQVISLFRTINDLRNVTSMLAVVAVDIKEDVIRDVFKHVNFSDNGAIYLYHEQERITSYKLEQNIALKENEIVDILTTVKRSEDMPIIHMKEASYYVIFQPIAYSNWEIAALIPVQEIRQKSDVIKQFTLYIGIFVVLLATIPAMLLSNRLTQGLRTLVRHMQDVRQGNYGKMITVTGNDEIAGLQVQYNNMIVRIKELVEAVYEMGVKKQAAEMTALESQIKPHFLYNTLDTMKWMAIKIKADNIVHLVDALSKFFRLGLNRGEELTSVMNELNHIQAFMNIQHIRYAEKLQFHIQMDYQLLHLPIIKLILQPLVENAVIHGVQQKENSAGTVIVRVYSEDEQLIFDVIDDGIGMTKERLLSLANQRIDSGYGVKNVQHRIKIFYGMNASIEYYSQLGIGTLVRIRLPLSKDQI